MKSQPITAASRNGGFSASYDSLVAGSSLPAGRFSAG